MKMEDTHPDLFDRLPEDVIQMIFAAIYDCKSLVRCMAVSRAFFRHATCISSLSIVCPDNYSSYEEKLKKIYSMVKEFQELQTLVVRVGRPKDEPASWARCMRYAEIGASVEKFMFMAAKSGDFSELDNALTRSEYGPDFDNAILKSRTLPDGTEGESEDQRGVTSNASISTRGNSNGTENIDSCHCSESRLGRESQQASMNPGLIQSLFLQNRLCFQGCPRIRRLSDFSLRQVIAPSNDVMRRMLPVIHFAILQGLNEFRDVIPSFIVNFPKLNRFLLVDLLESVTIHLRQHHLDEIRASYLQDMTDWECDKCEREYAVSENNINCELPSGKFSETNHETTQTQFLKSESPENGFMSSLDNKELSKSDKNEGILSRETGSTPKNELDCGIRPINLHASERHNISEDLDLGEKLSVEANVEKRLRKGKGLLEELPQITDYGTGNIESFYVKSEHANISNAGKTKEGYHIHVEQDDVSSSKSEGAGSAYSREGSQRLCSLGMTKESYHIHVEKDDMSCSQSEGAGSGYSHESSQRLSYGNHDRTSEFIEEKGNPKAELPPCQYDVLRCDADGLCRNYESLAVPEHGSCQTSGTSKNRWSNSHKISHSSECLHGLTMCEKLLDKRCFKSRTASVGGWDCVNSQAMDDGHNFASTETVSHLSKFENAESCNIRRDCLHVENAGNGYRCGLLGENEEDRQDQYRRRSPRFHDIYMDGKLDIASRHPFKRGAKTDNSRLRDSSRNIKIGSVRSLDDSSSSLENLRKTEESLGKGIDAYERKRHLFEIENEPPYPRSLEDSPVSSCPNQKHQSSISVGFRCGQNAMTSPFQSSHIGKDGVNTEADKCMSRKDNLENSNLGALQYENGFTNNHSCGINSRSNILQERTGQEENIKESSSSSSTRIVGSMQANQGRFIDDRLIERELWKEMWRERVRRSRDARRSTRILDDERRECEGQRVARNAFQRRKNDLEKEALSFDYSFWRAEQVVAENYHLSDVSMCIATYSAKPLGVADIDILSCAALAGPLLAATVSHVNKQHSSHNL